MSRRRNILLPFVALLAAFAFVAGACGGDDDKADDDKKTTTTEKKSDSDSDEGDTSTTVSDADFEKAVAQAKDALADAADDPCKVMQTFETSGMEIGNPSNTEQRKQATELAVAFYLALADAAPDDLSAEADQIRETVKKIEKEGEESNWSEEFLNEPEAIKGDASFNEASGKIMTAFTTQCSDTPATSTP